MAKQSIWDNFTNLYPVQKTLRFELVPVGSDGKRLSPEESERVFKNILEEDKKVKEAYTALKPILDSVHEKMINSVLTSEQSQQIDFSSYLEEYRKGKNRNLTLFEDSLRKQIGETFNRVAQEFVSKENEKFSKSEADNSKNTDKEKKLFKKNNIECLMEAGILKFLEKNISDFVSEEKVPEFIRIEENLGKDGKTKLGKFGYLATFQGFSGYLDGYNENRKNYYEYKKEAKTSVATRIVHENLPKFCDNLLIFDSDRVRKDKKTGEETIIPSRKKEYLSIYKFLKDRKIDTKIKDAETKEYIEAKPINEESFKISRFSTILSQSGIEEYNKIIGHYNQIINLYNQARAHETGFQKLSRFKTLYKQIGCGERKFEFFEIKYDTKEEQKKANESPEKNLNLEETLELVSSEGQKFFNLEKKDSSLDGNPGSPLLHFIDWLEKTQEWDGVYWTKSALNTISNKYLQNWHDIQDTIVSIFQSKDKEKIENLHSIGSYDQSKEDPLKIHDAVELSVLFEIIDEQYRDASPENNFKETVVSENKDILNLDIPPSKIIIQLIMKEIKSAVSEFINQSEQVLDISDYRNEENITKIKGWLDKAKSVQWIVKYFDVKEGKEKGHNVNPDLSNLLKEILAPEASSWMENYDAIRNYLTKKPQDDAKKNKLKLNFGNPQLLGGWSDGEEKNKGGVLLRNEGTFYLGILIKRNIFDSDIKNNELYLMKPNDTNSGRLILRNLKFQTLAGKGFIRDFGIKYSEIENDQDAIEKLQTLIRKQYESKYPLLKTISRSKYASKKDFDQAVKDRLLECYECEFTPVHWEKVLERVKLEELLLFEIYNKDFSKNKGEKSQGSHLNLHTHYWNSLFESGSTSQLSGGGEIFFRERALEVKTVHEKGTPIFRRKDKTVSSVFSHTIIKDRRFTNPKFLFHIPIKQNYQGLYNPFIQGKVNQKTVNSINQSINDTFSQSKDLQFLGIDRGEKHLIYYSLLDSTGKIKEQGHLDVINGKDYLAEINESARIRREKQENWQQKGNIANLKDGYISLVVHELIQKMKDQDGNFIPTFIVLEDLNPGFKRSRQKFEQQVYQKFELALAKKLNYLVDKSKAVGEIGSVSHALQLTPPILNFQDIEGKMQVGTMLYTRANYTSVTDPVTGWRKTTYLKKGSEGYIKEQILEKFSDFGKDEKGDFFFYYVDQNIGKSWTLWSSHNGIPLDRFRGKRSGSKNVFEIEKVDLNKGLSELFERFDHNHSYREQIIQGKDLKKIDDRTAWESLRYFIDLIQQIRNNGDIQKGEEDNFLLSPVRNEEGTHFDSRKHANNELAELPKDADANGAFNIARKGILMAEHIKYHQQTTRGDRNKGNLNLYISDREWGLWTSDQKQWEKELSDFAIQQSKAKAESKTSGVAKKKASKKKLTKP